VFNFSLSAKKGCFWHPQRYFLIHPAILLPVILAGKPAKTLNISLSEFELR
jgi:hypothetical protein